MLLSFLFSYFGFAALSLAKNRHYQQVWPDQKLLDTTAKILPTLGWTLLALGSVYIFQTSKISIAITEWLGMLSVAALLLILQFSYYPQSVAGIVWINSVRKNINCLVGSGKKN
ncbi:MAG: DUF3325 domain-containing protein [Cellvibrio sp.]